MFWYFPAYTQLLIDHKYEVTSDAIVRMFFDGSLSLCWGDLNIGENFLLSSYLHIIFFHKFWSVMLDGKDFDYSFTT